MWMQRTLDLPKVSDLTPYDNLNCYDTNSLWQMLKGLKTTTGRSRCSSERELDQVGAFLERLACPKTSLFLAWEKHGIGGQGVMVLN